MNKSPKRIGLYYVYIVECKNEYYYTGYTSNIENRIKLHEKGHGAKYLRGKGPIKLVYAKEYRYYKNALNAERRLKKITRTQKKKLIKTYQNKKNMWK